MSAAALALVLLRAFLVLLAVAAGGERLLHAGDKRLVNGDLDLLLNRGGVDLKERVQAVNCNWSMIFLAFGTPRYGQSDLLCATADITRDKLRYASTERRVGYVTAARRAFRVVARSSLLRQRSTTRGAAAAR